MITFFDTHGIDHDNNSAFQNLHLIYVTNLRLFFRRQAPYNRHVAFEALAVPFLEIATYRWIYLKQALMFMVNN